MGDQVRKEAPKQNKKYYPLDTETEKVNYARSRAYIHLYLKVMHGLIDFKEREHFITDGPNDGGIDGYYIDREKRTVSIIQSKFRGSGKNFEQKEITLNELLSMDVGRITDGDKTDESGNKYSGKIEQFQRELSEVPDIGKYLYEVIILANLKNVKPSQLKKLTGGFAATVFDFERTYNELVFPVVSGTFYKAKRVSLGSCL